MTRIEDFASVLMTENHAVDRMMRDPDQAGETGPEVGKLSERC